MKNKKKLLIAIGILIILCLTSVVVYRKYKKPEIKIDLSYEKIIPPGFSVLVRLDDLYIVWSDFKGTNFYSRLNDFFAWFWQKMPSESLGFSKDIRDIQKSIGFKLDEKNILAFLGKKLLVAMWLENIEDRKILVISNLDTGSSLFKEFKMLSAQKTGIDEYRNVMLNVFGENKYWCLIDDKFVISNDIGTVRKVIDLSANVSDRSVFSDAEFKRNITKIATKSYIYIKPQKINFVKYNLVKNEIKSVLLSVKFKNGILTESYVFRKQSFSPKRPQRIQSLAFIPENVLLCAAGNYPYPYFIPNRIIERTIVSNDYGFMSWPVKSGNTIMVYCKVKNKRLFLDKFTEFTKSTLRDKDSGLVNYKLPFLGMLQFKYFFVKDYFIICSPPEISENIRDFMSNRKPLLSESENFKRLNIPAKSNGIFYINFPGIFAAIFKKGFPDFIQPSGGYTLFNGNGAKTVFFMPMVDLPVSEWAGIFSGIKKLTHKKIIMEKEKITRKNLFYLRKSLNIYNTRTSRYPKKLDSLIDEYLDEIPQELLTRSSKVSPEADGSGGWFYKNGRVSVNVLGNDVSGFCYTQW